MSTDNLITPSIKAKLEGTYKEERKFSVRISENNFNGYGGADVSISLRRADRPQGGYLTSVMDANLYTDPTCCGAFLLNLGYTPNWKLLPALLEIVENYVRDNTRRGFVTYAHYSKQVTEEMEKAGWPLIARFYNPNSRHYVNVWGKAVRTPRDKRPSQVMAQMPVMNARVVGLG
jgi:hypothetical protein